MRCLNHLIWLLRMWRSTGSNLSPRRPSSRPSKPELRLRMEKTHFAKLCLVHSVRTHSWWPKVRVGSLSFPHSHACFVPRWSHVEAQLPPPPPSVLDPRYLVLKFPKFTPSLKLLFDFFHFLFNFQNSLSLQISTFIDYAGRSFTRFECNKEVWCVASLCFCIYVNSRLHSYTSLPTVLCWGSVLYLNTVQSWSYYLNIP